jgi:hypothetical protein
MQGGELKMPGPQNTSEERGNIYRSMEVLGKIQKQISSSEGGSFLLLNVAGASLAVANCELPLVTLLGRMPVETARSC